MTEGKKNTARSKVLTRVCRSNATASGIEITLIKMTVQPFNYYYILTGAYLKYKMLHKTYNLQHIKTGALPIFSQSIIM